MFVEGTRPNVDEEVCQKKRVKIDDIDPSIFCDVYKRLDIPDACGNDWRRLAGKLGYTVKHVRVRNHYFS